MTASTPRDRRRAVFIDRDGTIVEEVEYLRHPDQLALFPWSAVAIRALNQAGFAVVVITNQSGVARGYFDEEMVRTVHARLGQQLADGGAVVDAYYYCPHHPDGAIAQYTVVCHCRKPEPGLIERAAAELGVEPRDSFVVGDRWLDVALGRRVGARSVLVRTGCGAAEELQPPEGLAADCVVDNLVEAVGWILAR